MKQPTDPEATSRADETPDELAELSDLAEEFRRRRGVVDRAELDEALTAPVTEAELDQIQRGVLRELEEDSPLSECESRQLEAGVLRRLGAQRPAAKPGRAGWRRALAPAAVVPALALAASLALFVLTRGGADGLRDPLPSVPSFQLEPPSANASDRSSPVPPDLGDPGTPSALPRYHVGRELRFVLRPATRTDAPLRVSVWVEPLDADASGPNRQLVELPASVESLDGGAREVRLQTTAPTWPPGIWRLLFVVGPAAGEHPEVLARESLPAGWQRLEFALKLEAAPEALPRVTE